MKVWAGKHEQDGDRRVVFENEALPSYVDEFRDEGRSLRLAEVACDRHVTSHSDLHGILNLAAQHRILFDSGCGDMRSEIAEHEEEWDLEGPVTVEALEHTEVGGKRRLTQDACRAKK